MLLSADARHAPRRRPRCDRLGGAGQLAARPARSRRSPVCRCSAAACWPAAPADRAGAGRDPRGGRRPACRPATAATPRSCPPSCAGSSTPSPTRCALFDAVLVGGAATDPALLARARAAGVRVVTTYGMTETARRLRVRRRAAGRRPRARHRRRDRAGRPGARARLPARPGRDRRGVRRRLVPHPRRRTRSPTAGSRSPAGWTTSSSPAGSTSRRRRSRRRCASTPTSPTRSCSAGRTTSGGSGWSRPSSPPRAPRPHLRRAARAGWPIGWGRPPRPARAARCSTTVPHAAHRQAGPPRGRGGRDRERTVRDLWPRPAQWLAGARPRTLPAAVAPVLVGTGAAAALDGFRLVAGAPGAGGRARAAGGGQLRQRLLRRHAAAPTPTGSGRCAWSARARPRPRQVLRAPPALAFAVAAVAGLALAALSSWWLVAVGAVCIVAAWTYTGGPLPYGYRALGEVFVFVFFGPVAVVGTTFVQTRHGRGPRRRRVGAHRAADRGDPGGQQPAGHRRRRRRRASAPWPCCWATGPPGCSSWACSSSRSRWSPRIGVVRPWALLGLLAVPLAVPPLAHRAHRRPRSGPDRRAGGHGPAHARHRGGAGGRARAQRMRVTLAAEPVPQVLLGRLTGDAAGGQRLGQPVPRGAEHQVGDRQRQQQAEEQAGEEVQADHPEDQRQQRPDAEPPDGVHDQPREDLRRNGRASGGTGRDRGCSQPCRPSHLVERTTVVRVRATPLIRFNAPMVASSAGMSVTRTLST